MSSAKTVSKEYKQNCTKSILKTFKARKEALAHEIYLHNLFEVAINPAFFNAAKQTSTGFDTTGIPMHKYRSYKMTDETKKQISNKLKGQQQSPETKAKRAATLKSITPNIDPNHYKRLGELNRQRLLGTTKTKKYIFASDVKDKTIRIFYNKNTNITECMTTWELKQKYDLGDHIYSVVKGVRQSYKKWIYKGTQNEYTKCKESNNSSSSS
jgi:hypothetical protein